MKMITKVSSVYRVTLQNNDQRQNRNGDKKKTGDQFKDILAKVIHNSSEKTTR